MGAITTVADGSPVRSGSFYSGGPSRQTVPKQSLSSLVDHPVDLRSPYRCSPQPKRARLTRHEAATPDPLRDCQPESPKPARQRSLFNFFGCKSSSRAPDVTKDVTGTPGVPVAGGPNQHNTGQERARGNFYCSCCWRCVITWGIE